MFTYEQAKAKLLELAAERPDYVYVLPRSSRGAAVYADDDGNPSCIVGYVLVDLDPEAFEDAHRREENSFSPNYGSIAPERVSPAAQLLDMAQDLQDAGFTWGRAVRDAIEYADRLR